MESGAILPVRAVEVLRSGHLVSPIVTASAVSSRRVGWNGIALEAFHEVPSNNIPEHEHPTHFLNLFTSGRVRARWTMDGRTRTADHGSGTLYLLPAGSRDLASWSGPSSRIVLVMSAVPRSDAGRNSTHGGRRTAAELEFSGPAHRGNSACSPCRSGRRIAGGPALRAVPERRTRALSCSPFRGTNDSRSQIPKRNACCAA